ncbi:MAG: carbohydrate-binding domain-containing protein [Tannerella sp.]|nr:carbohydrate-binding domain-containing protein [Tannerella sp.]
MKRGNLIQLIKGGIYIFVVIVSGFMLNFCKSEEIFEDMPQIFSIGGVVTKSDGGVASGASIMLVNAFDDSDIEQSSTTITGEYVITGVSAGSYKIIVALTGYETNSIDGIKVLNTDITLDEIVLQKIIVPTYVISGTVTKSDGSAAAGASVQVKKAGDNVYVGQAVTTDASGTYSIGDIPSGKYNIIIMLDGYDTGILSDVMVNNADLTSLNVILQTITINANAVNIVFSDNDVTIDNLPSDGSVTATKNGADVTIVSSATKTVECFVSGATSNGSLKIQNNATVPNTLRLTLNNVMITSASKLPPIQVTKNEGVTIVELKGNNILSDNASNEENATLITKSGSFEFEGYGKLNISGIAKHAIASSKKSITVRGGDINVASAASDGLHAEAGFEISDGSLDITASGDGIDAGSGTAILNGGKIRITSRSDDTKGIKADAGISVNGGVVEMAVSGAQSKGISSKADITVAGGDLSIIVSGATVLEPVGSGYDPSYCTAIKSDANIIVTDGIIHIESGRTSDGGKGISADGDILISNGTLNITTAGDGKVYTSETGATDSYTSTCIKSDQNIALLGGKITCSSSGTGGKGIDADRSITIGNAGANNADLTLTVGTSGARFLVSGSSGGGGVGRPGGGFGSNGSDYANPKAIKSEGDMTVNSGTVVINCTQTSEGGEGLESKGALTVNGGNISINSYDDCINGGTSVTINGGNIFVAARGQDAIDSNGSLVINGGLTIANGVRGDGEALDGQTGRYPINGGVIVGTCGNLMEVPAGPQRAVIYSRATAGSDICIKNAAGETILLFRVPVISGASSGTSVIVVFSDPRLVSGTYTLFYNGKIEGGANYNGYITGGAYSGGASKSFTIGNATYTQVQ